MVAGRRKGGGSGHENKSGTAKIIIIKKIFEVNKLRSNE